MSVQVLRLRCVSVRYNVTPTCCIGGESSQSNAVLLNCYMSNIGKIVYTRMLFKSKHNNNNNNNNNDDDDDDDNNYLLYAGYLYIYS